MMSEEDKQRIIEAKGCNDCREWHRYCHSECCRIVFLQDTDPEELRKPGKYIFIRGNVDPSMIWYFKLRGVEYNRGILKIKKEFVRQVGTQLLYIRDCDMLENLLCKGHPDNKPKICKLLNAESVPLAAKNNFVVTANCLFRYKNMEDGKNEQTREG